mmetsp:Transcript_23743/g.72573  ORF Transcript_23743/g.72573 Transcript_23743/m.72573 type:complete len:210 (+) Transcript_23743:1155-1784(+)
MCRTARWCASCAVQPHMTPRERPAASGGSAPARRARVPCWWSPSPRPTSGCVWRELRWRATRSPRRCPRPHCWSASTATSAHSSGRAVAETQRSAGPVAPRAGGHQERATRAVLTLRQFLGDAAAVGVLLVGRLAHSSCCGAQWNARGDDGGKGQGPLPSLSSAQSGHWKGWVLCVGRWVMDCAARASRLESLDGGPLPASLVDLASSF